MAPFFSFDGRIRRKDFWINTLVLIGVSIVISVVVGMMGIGGAASMSDSDGDNSAAAMAMMSAMGISMLFQLPVIISGISISVRRWHDLNKSGWWVLIGLIPILGGIYAFIMTGFIEGTVGPNQYGEDPKAAERGMAPSAAM